MSGGVDSSVAAALMKDAGHEVMGVTLKLWSGPGGEAPTAGCCTVSDAEDARRVAAQLDIPYYVLDHTDDFRDGVVDRFIEGYVSGRTPNPCIECNRTVKFDRLLSRLDDFECDVLVTGHHARSRDVDGVWQLLRGADAAKDQSYVLHMLDQAALAQMLLPVGSMTKADVRRTAEALDLRTAAKPDSQDVCFIQAGPGRRGFLGDRLDLTPGRVVDAGGRQLGSVDAVELVTVGQRRGLGLRSGEPRFVTAVDIPTATVTVGRREDLLVDETLLTDLVWADCPVTGAVEVQCSAHGEVRNGVLGDDRVVWSTPQPSVAPGQSLVFYDGDEVLGGAIAA
jgi:tRNA-specific 2-thiouridylase